MRIDLFFIILSLFFSCTTFRKKELGDYQRWAYQLQGYEEYTKLFQTQNTMWVIDYSKDGSSQKKWDLNEIKKVQDKNNMVLSYLSIGEAESYRYYFDKMPKDLLFEENKDWKGNFRVKYWDSRWQNILWGSPTSYLDQIIAQGFNGVYLDIVDAFEYYPELEKADKALKMAYLIMNLSAYAKSINPDFVIVSQNGANILKYLKEKKKYLSYIDGLACESLFFYGPKKMNNSWNPQKDVLSYVYAFSKAGKKVFSVEYVNYRSKVNKYFSYVQGKPLIPLVTSKALSGKMKLAE